MTVNNNTTKGKDMTQHEQRILADAKDGHYGVNRDDIEQSFLRLHELGETFEALIVYKYWASL